MMSARNNIYESRPFTEQKVLKECRDCFASEPDRIAETGERFMDYFIKNATPEGVLFKTIKQITMDMNIPHLMDRLSKAAASNRGGGSFFFAFFSATF